MTMTYACEKQVNQSGQSALASEQQAPGNSWITTTDGSDLLALLNEMKKDLQLLRNLLGIPTKS